MYDYMDIDSVLDEKVIPYRNLPHEIRYQLISKKISDIEELSRQNLTLDEICERVFLGDKDIDQI